MRHPTTWTGLLLTSVTALALAAALSCAVNPTDPFAGWGRHGAATMKSYWKVEEGRGPAFTSDMAVCQSGSTGRNAAPEPPTKSLEGSRAAQKTQVRPIDYGWIERCMKAKGWDPK